jgi:hypothetical protein
MTFLVRPQTEIATTNSLPYAKLIRIGTNIC